MLVAAGRTMSGGALLVPDPRPASPPVTLLHAGGYHSYHALHRARSSGTTPRQRFCFCLRLKHVGTGTDVCEAVHGYL